MKRNILMSMLAIFLIVGSSQAQNKFEKWNITFDKEINWIKMSDSGILLVGADDGLYGLDPESGETKWSFKKLKKVTEDMIEVVEGTDYIIGYRKGIMNVGKIMIINSATGELKYDVYERYKILAGKGATPIYQNKSFLLMDDVRAINIDAESGEINWEVKDFLGKNRRAQVFRLNADNKGVAVSIKGNQPFMFDSPSTFIAHLQAGHFAKYDLNTGKQIWDFDFKGNKIKLGKEPQVSAPRLGYAFMQLDQKNKRVYLPVGNSLLAVNSENGSFVWMAQKKSLPGKVISMQKVEEGILVMFQGKKTGINIIDYNTGEPKWEKSISVKTAGPLVFSEGKVYALDGKSIVKIDATNGTTELITKKGMQLGGKESPNDIMSYQEKLIVTSAQNVMGFNKDGGIAFQTYLKANQESGLAKFGKIVTSIALTAMSYASAYSRAASTGSDQSYNVYSFGTKRFANSKDRFWYKYISTKVTEGDEKGFGVARVDKRTGKVVKQIVIGERELTYEIDEIDHLLYAKKGKKDIVCYEF